jgi:gliding motility-associated-like protein
MAGLKERNTNNGLPLITLITLLFCFTAKAQIITTVAGNGSQIYSGNGGIATGASVDLPNGIAVDKNGIIYIGEAGDYRLREVLTSGTIYTIAGSGTSGFSGDGGPATAAQFNYIYDIKVDDIGNIYLADIWNYRIRKINTAGIITTICGNGISGTSGDGGPATAAYLSDPSGIAFDPYGCLYIADGARIRKINTAGIITTVAGTGINGYGGDGGPATAAQLWGAGSVAFDGFGNMYIEDNNRIRQVNTSGIITTIAGTGVGGFSGDGGPATLAQFYGITNLIVDAYGNIYVSDSQNERIRVINTAGIVTTFAGNGSFGYSGDGGPATAAEIWYPVGLGLDLSGNLYICDQNNNVVRKVTVPCSTPTVQVVSSTDSICKGESITLLGVGASTYTWLPGGNTNPSVTMSPSVTTVYTLTAATGTCSATTTYTLYVSPLPVGDTLISTSIPICSGDSIILKGTGANTYTWTSISYTVTAADSIINGIKFTPMAGTDTFSVKGKDTITGCVNTATISVLVKQPPTLTVSPALPATICPGASVSFTVSGGAAVTGYTWSPTTNLSPSASSTVIVVSPTVSTSYQVMGLDTNGCTGSNEAIVIIPQDSISVNSPSICQSNSVALNASSIPMSYTWSPATGLSSTSGSSVIANPYNTTVYTIAGTDNFGCHGTTTATVTVNSLPTFSISNTPTKPCSGNPDVLMANAVNNYTYTWSNGTVGAITTVFPAIKTKYTVTGTDTNGCSNTDTLLVLVNPLPNVAINSGVTSFTLNLGQSITLNAGGANTYSWTSGNVSCDSCASNTESPVASTQYCVRGTDVNGCRDSVCLQVIVEEVCTVFIPDAFSPNGDGHNDVFKVYGHCITELTLQVFDRWGNQVYSGSDPSAGWDGSYGGSLMNTGTYIYQVQYTLSNGTKTKTKGNFSLMR